MTLEKLQHLLEEIFPAGSITLRGDLYHVQIEICDPSFDGLSRIARDKKVYQHLSPLIASGALHAVTLKTSAPLKGDA